MFERPDDLAPGWRFPSPFHAQLMGSLGLVREEQASSWDELLEKCRAFDEQVRRHPETPHAGLRGFELNYHWNGADDTNPVPPSFRDE